MQRDCAQCGAPFNDGCDIVAIVRTKFKAIPSRVAYAIHNPTEVYEMQHYLCSLGDLLPEEVPPEDATD